MQAADERDTTADARDRQADTSDNNRYRSEFLDQDTLVHGDRWTERRDAVIGREHSSDDRSASRADRIALTADLTQ
jgi:hypothetical protein